MAIFQSLTIRQIAEKANVSIATVSRALNGTGSVKESTMERIRQAIDALGYEPPVDAPAPRPRSGRLLASFPDLDNPFNSGLIQGMLDAASRRGYHVAFYVNTNYSLSSGYRLFLEEDCFYDGLLLAHTLPQSLIPSLTARFPVVMCSEHIPNAAIPYVAIDDYAAACTAVNYLISTGRKNIACINSSLNKNYAVHRERGYRDCLQKAGLPIREEWIVHLPDVSFNLAVGSVAALFDGEQRPDAFFCVSDVFAAAVIKLAAERHIPVPGELGVIGFDDINLTAMTTPTITTIRQPAYQMGSSACNLLIEQVENPAGGLNRVILSTDLVVRDST